MAERETQRMPTCTSYSPDRGQVFTDGSYTKGTRAHTHRELIRFTLGLYTLLVSPRLCGV